MYRILAYKLSGNLGDAMQTYAMARLLPQPLQAVYRHTMTSSVDHSNTFVVNGWLKGKPPKDSNCLFAGVYLGDDKRAIHEWATLSKFSIGLRDAHTQGVFKDLGDASRTEVVGCATMTLPRYEGKRKGVLNVDLKDMVAPGQTESLTQEIPLDMTWEAQWKAAVERFEELRTAEVVYTKRLHVVLPCLAFGTPVVVPSLALPHTFQPQRLKLFDDIGFQYDKPFTMDMTRLADRFKQFLSEQLGIAITPIDNPPMPLPLDA